MLPDQGSVRDIDVATSKLWIPAEIIYWAFEAVLTAVWKAHYIRYSGSVVTYQLRQPVNKENGHSASVTLYSKCYNIYVI
jgi:hypothetical protein